MRPAVLLGVGALLAAGAANAQNPTVFGYDKVFAQETFTATGATTVGGETYYPFRFDDDKTGRVFVPMALLANLAYYVRLELGNLRVARGDVSMKHSLSNASLTDCMPPHLPNTAEGIAPAAYLDNNTAAVYQLESTTTLAINRCLIFSLQRSGLDLQATGGPMTVKAVLYDSLAGAYNANEANMIGETAAAKVGFVAPAVTARAVPLAAATASVERGFAAFTGASPSRANLATVSLLTSHANFQVIQGGTVNADNTISGGTTNDVEFLNAKTGTDLTAAAARALVSSARVYVKSDRGDFSTGDFKLAAGAGATGCPTAKLAKVASGDRTGQLMGALTGATAAETLEARAGTRGFPRVRQRFGIGPGCVLSMDVTANAAEEAKNPPGDFKAIKAQKFTVDMEVTLAGSVPARFARPNLSGAAAGEIKRDGTTVHLPYLTTRPGYTQKVVLTNRGTKSADFWIESVSSSDGTGAASKVTASVPMNVAAQSRKSVAVGDLVNLGAGGTTGAATLSVNAARANLSVASVLTNLASNSTDTLSLVNPAMQVDAAAAPAPTPTTPTTTPDAGTGGGGTPPPTQPATNCYSLGTTDHDSDNRTPDVACRSQMANASCTSNCCNATGGGNCTASGAAACPIVGCP